MIIWLVKKIARFGDIQHDESQAGINDPMLTWDLIPGSESIQVSINPHPNK